MLPSRNAQLQEARARSIYAFVELLCAFADEADRLLASGQKESALDIYSVIAEQEVDGAEEQVIDHARRVLEREGLASPPSFQSEYDQYLQKMPEFDRHMFLARRALPTSPREAMTHLSAAAKIRPLSKKDSRIYAGLVSRFGEVA
jgi:hypothetical protein